MVSGNHCERVIEILTGTLLCLSRTTGLNLSLSPIAQPHLPMKFILPQHSIFFNYLAMPYIAHHSHSLTIPSRLTQNRRRAPSSTCFGHIPIGTRSNSQWPDPFFTPLLVYVTHTSSSYPKPLRFLPIFFPFLDPWFTCVCMNTCANTYTHTIKCTQIPYFSINKINKIFILYKSIICI